LYRYHDVVGSRKEPYRGREQIDVHGEEAIDKGRSGKEPSSKYSRRSYALERKGRPMHEEGEGQQQLRFIEGASQQWRIMRIT